jgi:hypothetical protein
MKQKTAKQKKKTKQKKRKINGKLNDMVSVDENKLKITVGP